MLKFNVGVETATSLEMTRRAIRDLKGSVRRVSSGVALESAADDPGAIGSVTFSETAISGIQRTLRNLNEGITATQVLTEDLSVVEDLLLTLREVATQAASDQFTDAQRQDLQVAAKDILRKVDVAVRSAGQREGISLTKNSSISIGGSSTPSLNTQLVITDLLVDDLGKRAIYTSQRNGVFTSALTEGALQINGVEIRPTNAADDPSSTSARSGSAIAKAAAINAATSLTGVTAIAGATEIAGNRAVSAVNLTGLNYMSINGSVITGVEVGANDNLEGSLREAINAERQYTGVTATLNDVGHLVLRADDGRNIFIKYSTQEVLNAIGITDKEGDAPNLSGAVALNATDRNLKGEVQLPINTDFQGYGGNVSVGGRFDASEDYVDFVAHVTRAGGFGVAEIRLDRDPAGDAIAAEDFAFIEGSVSPTVDASSVTGNFFTINGGSGAVSASGTYNEALDRDYIIRATQAGTTDGAERAQFQVSTADDGVVGTFTASAQTDILIAGSRTGEDVSIQFSASPRQSTLSSALASGHAHDTGVTLGGAYTGLTDSTTTVEVISSGRTQGSPQATAQVYHDGIAFGGVTNINGGAPLDIGNGQTLTIASDTASFSGVTVSKTGPYNQAVTVNSDPANFTGVENATYRVKVTQAGSLGEAQYVVEKTNSSGTTQLAGDSVLQSGTVTLADGVTFNFPDTAPNIGSTSVSTSHGQDTTDHYQAYGSVRFNGTYDGALGDTNLIVRAKRSGVVLDTAESEAGRDDYATLEYSINGGAFTGDLVARRGDIAISNGVNLNLAEASNPTTLVDVNNINSDFGSSESLSGASVGYSGTIDFAIDTASFSIAEDVRVRFTAATAVDVSPSGSPPSGDTLTVDVVGESGTVHQSTNIQPVSGTTYTVADGLTVTLNNSGAESESINAVTNAEIIGANIHALQASDQFSVALAASRLAVGDSYSVNVDSAHLEDGTVYTVENLLGRFEVGDELIVDADHAFQSPVYTLSNNVNLLNGLSLDFDQDGAFEIGDEVRFQVRGYTGDPVASGTYTNAISPTTFTVEVTSTGDVDGGAQFQFTRADTGETVTGLNVSSSATALDDGVEISFTAGRVYAGDQFFIDTFESLTQTFGGELTLSSATTIELQLANADTDNLLGRLAYSGSTPKAPGTDGNLTEAVLGFNADTAVGRLDLTTQERAKMGVTYTQNAQESLSQYQSRVSLVQARLEDISSSLERDLQFKQDELDRVRAVDPQVEGPRRVEALTQVKSNSMLTAIERQMTLQSLSLLQESITPPPALSRSGGDDFKAQQSQKRAARGNESGSEANTHERVAAQEEQYQESATRLQEMMNDVEAAQQRSTAVVVNLNALRQLSQAHLNAQATEMQLGRATAVESTTSTNANLLESVMNNIGSSSRGIDTQRAKRAAQEGIAEARSYLQKIKALTLEVQNATSDVSVEAQQAKINALIAKLQQLELPSARRDQSVQGGEASAQLTVSSAVTRQLGQFSKSASDSVDPSLPLKDGELTFITSRGQSVPVRGTRPQDDPDSVADALGSAKAKAAAINDRSQEHGVLAISGPTVAYSAGQIGAANLSGESRLLINGVILAGVNVTSGDSDSALRDAINALSSNNGVTATSTRGGGLRLNALDGRNITVDAYGEATKLGLTARGAGRAERRTTGGMLTLSSRDYFVADLRGSREGIDQPLGTFKSIPSSHSINQIDITTSLGRVDTLSVVNLALADLEQVNKRLK